MVANRNRDIAFNECGRNGLLYLIHAW